MHGNERKFNKDSEFRTCTGNRGGSLRRRILIWRPAEYRSW